MSVVLGERRLELARHRPRQLADVDLFGAQLERPRFQPREVQEVDGELAQALDLILQLLDEPPAVLGLELLVLQ